MNLALPSSDAQAAWVALIGAATRATAQIEAALKSAGLPGLAWYDALYELDKAGAPGLRPFELQDRLLLPQYGMSRLLARLQRAGLVDRRPCDGDGRGQVAAITAKGRELRARMWPVYAGALSRAVGDRLADGEARRLAHLAGKIAPRER